MEREGTPQGCSQGGSEVVTSRAGDNWTGESWAERAANAKGQEEVRIFWKRRKTG